MKNLEKIVKKYSEINHNEENFEIGGGLSDGKFASNRHEDAKNDEGKLTLGKAVQMFKKATENDDTDFVKEVLQYAVPNMEWHHAGKLPKQYGGGMKKTYFINSKEMQTIGKYKLIIQKTSTNHKYRRFITIKICLIKVIKKNPMGFKNVLCP